MCEGTGVFQKFSNELYGPKEVTLEVLSNIIAERKPIGLFYSKEGEKFIAVDNCNGNAWTEEFETKEDCIDFLLGDNMD